MGVAPGTLFVVATPIGNLGDLTPRLGETLQQVALVAAEDTRRTRRLLTHMGLSVPLQSLHKFNERAQTQALVNRLKSGESIALVSDAGTPGICDPGYRLVAAAHAAALPVRAVAGPSAIASALSVAGLPADRFLFVGYLPHREQERRELLESLAERPETLVMFEAPHRLLAALKSIESIFGSRTLTLCRELTKMHEEVLVGTAESVLAMLTQRSEVLGEIVLVMEGASADQERREDPSSPLLLSFIDALQDQDGDPRRALAQLSQQSGTPRRELKRQLARLGVEFHS